MKQIYLILTLSVMTLECNLCGTHKRNLSNAKENPEIFSGFNEIQTRGLIAQVVEHCTCITEVCYGLESLPGFSSQLLY